MQNATANQKIERAKEKVVSAARAHTKAYVEAERLWHSDGDDPPDWNERMTKKHNLMERAVKQLLKATNEFEQLIGKGKGAEKEKQKVNVAVETSLETSDDGE